MERHTRFKVLVRPDSGTFATGTQDIGWKLERTDKRLKKLTLHMNVTLGGTGGAGTATDRLEGLCNKIRLVASDLGTSTRDVINGCSADILAWNRKHVATQSRYQQTCLGASTTGSTYDVFIELFIAHPDAEYPMAYYQCLPLHARNAAGIGVNDDVWLYVSMATINDAFLGLAAGTTITHNYQRLVLEYYEISESDPLDAKYLPREIATTTFDTGSSGGQNVKMVFPRDGWLESALFSEFSTYSTGIRGSVLTSSTTGKYTFEFRGVPITEIYPKFAVHNDELYAQSFATDVAPGSTHNLDASIWGYDWWKPDPRGAAGTGASLINLSTENRGDTLYLVPNDVAASKTIRVLTSKFLSNIGLTAGA